MYKIFPGQEWLIPDSTLSKNCFNEKLSSLAGLKKNFSFSQGSTDFGQFSLPRSTIKVDFLRVGENFRKILWVINRGGC